MVTFSNPGLDTIAKIKPYTIVYPDFSQNILITDIFSPAYQTTGATGTISIKNNILSVNFLNTWSARKVRTGVIKILNISPALPDIELGPILSSDGDDNTGYYAKIQNNSLVVYTLFGASFSSVATSPNLKSGMVGPSINYSLSLGNVFTCSTGSGASINISAAQRDVTIYLGTENVTYPINDCSLKTGIIAYLATSPAIMNNDLGPLKDNNGNPTGYGAKIENQNLIFYEMVSIPPLSTGWKLNFNYDLSGSDFPYDKNNHWIHSTTYDTKGNETGSSRAYFDNLAKSDVRLSKEYATDKIWGTETTFDNLGRPDKTSLIAPSPLDTFEKTNFLKSNSQSQDESYPTILSLNNISTNNNYKASQSISVTGTVTSGLTVSLTAPTITLSDKFLITATPGSSFVLTAAVLSDVSASPSLANYYSDKNTYEPYQATATHPFTQNNYDQLSPGNIINITGGNKINGEWKTGYSYTIPAAQEMYYVYGTSFFENNRDLESYLSKKEFPEYDNLGLSSYFMRTITAENQVMPLESIPGPGFNIMLRLGAPPYAVKTNYPLQRGKLYKVILGGETKIVQILNEINFRNETGVGDINININNPGKILSGSWDTYSEADILNKVSDIFNNPNNLVADLNYFKTIRIDANGIENVSFTDSEGKLLATAKSGGANTPYNVKSLIGPQGYVDIHLPQGCGGTLNFIVSSNLYNVYNLKTGNLLTTAEKSSIPSGIYRIELITKPTYSLGLTYIDRSNGSINNVLAEDLGVTYNVNYYDYAVNVYSKTGQLVKTIQPKGYTNNTSIIASPAHMTASTFSSTYKYNTLGQLIEVTSPDQGINKSAYRKEGGIRYSQSALQAQNSQVTYTNYDGLGRPIESGIITGTTGIWSLALNAVDNTTLISGAVSERSFSIYDYTENIVNEDNSLPTPYSLTIPSSLSLTTLATSLASSQNNLAGNIAVTYKTDTDNIINAITWYSYDLYGRTEWIAQYTDGIGIKTTHYEYDHNSYVKRVLFQKNTTELFVHQYTYDPNNGKLTKVETATSLSPENFITHADYTYYKTGELKRTNIGQGAQGLDYVYTLGGRLKSINHPSLESAKDPGGDNNDVFGLTLDYYNGDYLRTGRNITSSPTIGADYSGNIKAARWANRGFAEDQSGAKQKAYLYNYNRDNWLTNATYGNVNTGSAIITPATSYKEGDITYDANGNILTMKRSNASGITQDDLSYNYNTGKNQLNFIKDNVTTPVANLADLGNQSIENYKYDAIGQLTQNISENLKYLYNTQGLVIEILKNDHTLVKFLYNERGQRIKKESYTTASPYNLDKTTFYALDLSGNTLAVYNFSSSGTLDSIEETIYGMGRLGNCNRATPNVINYEITDHLGNVRAVIQKSPTGITTQLSNDYYPFGEQLPGRSISFLKYRYAFQGQELDTENGMEAFQLRLWDGRIGRWLSTDPYAQYASPYLGMGNNPINGIDSNGGAFFPTFGETKALSRGLWTGTKSLVSSLYYVGDTVDGIANLSEMLIAGTGILGGSTFMSPYANMLIYDAQYTKTNTAGLYLGINSSFSNYIDRLASDNEEITAEAIGEAIPSLFSLKGLGSASRVTVLSEVGVGGEVLALHGASRQLLLAQKATRIETNLALGLQEAGYQKVPGLFEFAQAKGFDTYKNFSTGFNQAAILDAMHRYDNIHFYVEGFSRIRYSKFNPTMRPSWKDYTNWEMHTIWNNPGLLSKTTFHSYNKDEGIFETYNRYSPN